MPVRACAPPEMGMGAVPLRTSGLRSRVTWSWRFGTALHLPPRPHRDSGGALQSGRAGAGAGPGQGIAFSDGELVGVRGHNDAERGVNHWQLKPSAPYPPTTTKSAPGPQVPTGVAGWPRSDPTIGAIGPCSGAYAVAEAVPTG